MPLTYTITTQNTPEYKSMLCGRTDDITALIDHIVQGNSVALFGERRIGKSSLLYLVKDVIDGSIGQYQSSLIDVELKSTIVSLQAKIPHYKSCYLSLQSLSQYDLQGFAWKLHRGGQQAGLLGATNLNTPVVNYEDMQIFEKLNTACGQGRLIVLIDEIEVLEDFSAQERKKVIRNLRDATAYANICFIIAGAENWYNHLKDESSPFSGILKKYRLVAPSQMSIKLHLVREPLEAYVTPLPSVNTIVTTILDWTAYKPFYIQIVCSAIAHIYQKHGQLPQNWQGTVLEDVYSNTVGEVLKRFYGDDSIDKLAQNILDLLANTPNLTAQQITRLLGYDKEVRIVKERLNDLVVFDKISKRDEKYYITGTLIERWGCEHKETPPIKSPWLQRRNIVLKLGVVLIAFILGLLALMYAYPSNATVPLKFADGTVFLEVPNSLEIEQTGTITVSVQNTSSHIITAVYTSLTSPDIDYQSGNSSTLTFKSIETGERQFMSPTFTVHSSLSTSSLTSQVIITEDGKLSRTVLSFDTSKRYPVRKYGGLIGLLLTGLAGSAILKDVLHFIMNAKATVPSEKSDSIRVDS